MILFRIGLVWPQQLIKTLIKLCPGHLLQHGGAVQELRPGQHGLHLGEVEHQEVGGDKLPDGEGGPDVPCQCATNLTSQS